MTDFARARVAKQQGFTVVIVDALYWMWASDPIDVRYADAYLCLAFPGVSDRITKIMPPCHTIKEIPQICESPLHSLKASRRGLILNFGGGTTPFGFSYDYAASLVQAVQNALSDSNFGDVLVTCSDAARDELHARSIQADIRSLSLAEMQFELSSRAALVTLPGLSIMWDAVAAQIPTFAVPGISYSQHQLVKTYLRYFQGIQFFTWDDLPGYGQLESMMDEGSGVRAATKMADRFAADRDSFQRLTQWLSSGLREARSTPLLRSDHPWGDFTGADKVADEALRLMFQ